MEVTFSVSSMKVFQAVQQAAVACWSWSRSRRNYYCRSHVGRRFHQLAGWIIRRQWSHRTSGGGTQPERNIRPHGSAQSSGWWAGLTDTFALGRESPFMKAGCGKTCTSSLCGMEAGARAIERASSAPTLAKRLNKGQLPTEVVEGRAPRKGNSR